MVFTGFDEVSWLIRHVLETCDTYDCAYQAFKNDKINALSYIILAGTKKDEGVVISRDRLSTIHEDKLNATNGKWYVVQTNSDHWINDTGKHHGCFNRCEAAKERLNTLGQDNLDIDNLRSKVFLQFPNFNGDTLFNTQFVPSAGFIDTISISYPWDTKAEQTLKMDTWAPENWKPFNVTTDLKLTEPRAYSGIMRDIMTNFFYQY